MSKQTVVEVFAIGGVYHLVVSIWAFDIRQPEIAEEGIDGSLCIPQPRLAKISIFLVSIW